MTQWTKKILRRKGGKGTVTNAEEDSDVKATKLMKFIEVTEPKDAVKGLPIRFMHDHGEGLIIGWKERWNKGSQNYQGLGSLSSPRTSFE